MPLKVFDGAAWVNTGGAPTVTVDEGASSNATFSTLTNPFGNGKNYRLVKFLSSGSLVVEEEGYADLFVLSAGGSGGGGYNSGSTSRGGGGGGAGDIHDTTVSGGASIFIPAGTHTITVGQGVSNSNGQDSSAFGVLLKGGRVGGTATGGYSANWFSPGSGTNEYHAGGGGGGGYTQNGNSANGSAPGGEGVQSNFDGTLSWYAAGGSGGGSAAYGASGGVNGISGSGGGGNAVANTGAGGGGSTTTGARGLGGSGIVMLRWEI